MPKRIPTPPIPEDAEYFTVSAPYPLNFVWDNQEDVVRLVRWVAACLGSSRPIWALYYKPSAAAKVILEIAKPEKHEESDKWKRPLFGEHRWREILKAPTDEEINRVSQIFPCVYGTGRQVQKHGWLCLQIEPTWFAGWSAADTFNVDPYPDTHFCLPPQEDKTNMPICRHLPAQIKPPPPSQPKPVPGSQSWIKVKEAPNAWSTVSLRGSWATNRGGVANRGRGGATSQLTARSTPIKPPNSQAISNGISSLKPSQNLVPTSAWNKKPTIVSPVPSRPPGLHLPSVGISKPPGLVHSSGSGSTDSSAGANSPTESFDTPLAMAMHHITVSESLEDHLAALAGEDDLDSISWDIVSVKADTAYDQPASSVPQYLDEEEQKPKCPEHDRVCNRHICKAYGKLLGDLDRRNRGKVTTKPASGPWNIKKAEQEEAERKRVIVEQERREWQQREEADGFTVKQGRGGRRGRGVRRGGQGGNGNSKFQGGSSHRSSPVPPATFLQDDDEEEPW